jgi:hypothetical protein
MELARRLHEAFAEFDDPKVVRLRGRLDHGRQNLSIFA